ncbi:hypothetical protein OEA41_006194 [Lepraria neglecta]|uniref:DUF1275 domain protein n=1 Tax=Lepraria neglecta TaxID=209136 RepID=A0AAE0DK99_9LECA|nr:hypothetical protein OEA41_006194 [Lepraria neglecta]
MASAVDTPAQPYNEDEEKGRISSQEQEPTGRGDSGAIARLRVHFTTDVSTAHADILLLTCCFISGLVDSTIYNAYGTFVSMQTGNTIFLGIGGATSFKQPPNPKPYGWAKSLTSIFCFCLGCFFFSRFSRAFGSLRRGTLVTSFLIQSVLIFISAAIVEAGVVNGNLNTIPSDIEWTSEIPIAFLSFQSAGQIIGSRTLNLIEIPSVVLTSMLCDLASDPKLTSSWKDNIKRNRRALAFFGILIGAVAGGFIAEGSGKMQTVLWIAGGLKVVITGSWMLWPVEKSPISDQV